MARDYARVKLSIWNDDDFRDLTQPAQGFYLALLTSPSLSYCGVLDWRPNRIAAKSKGSTVDSVRALGKELADALFLVVDENTEEALIRSFVRHDGLMSQPNVAAAMAKDFGAVSSRILRGVVVHELKRLHEAEPSLRGWGRAGDLLSKVSVDPSVNPSVWGSGWGSVTPSDEAKADPSVDPCPTPSPSPTPYSLLPAVPAEKTSRRSPERPLPDDWTPTDTHRKYAAENRIDLDREVFKFRNHAAANDRRQRNWNAAFTTWLARTQDYGPPKRQVRTDLPEAWQ